jgi:serine phosphatase RsbU (regulator of sigma subunit)
VIALTVTAGLAAISYELNQRNEHRLLNLQVKQTATVLQALLPGVETPLASGAEIAASGGSVPAFRKYMSGYAGPQKTFAGASLWGIRHGRARLLTAVGQRPILRPLAASTQHLMRAAVRRHAVALLGPLALSTANPRLGYTFSAAKSRRFVVYAESVLPPNLRAAPAQPGSTFSDLRFALYLGRTSRTGNLIETNGSRLPVPGDTAMVTVPFGASKLTLVAGSTGQLGGGLSGALWWVVAVAGTVLSVVGALTAERLVRRRRDAERLSARMETLHAEQRTIAQTLQQALLPQTLVAPPGLRVAARYLPGVANVEIGGDWYDVIAIDEGRAFFVIGDVSGRGLKAGTMMAALRFAIRGFVSEGHEPSTILDNVSRLVDVGRDGQFATVMCGVIDIERHEITIANAGHLPPLLLAERGVERYVETNVGPPIGVSSEHVYQSVIAKVPPRAIMLTFTDGLIEMPGETLDESLDRLRSDLGSPSSLDDTLERLTSRLAKDASDDVAILGVEWLK